MKPCPQCNGSLSSNYATGCHWCDACQLSWSASELAECDRPKMTDETRAFFARPEVKTWVAKVRAEHPGCFIAIDGIGGYAMTRDGYERFPDGDWCAVHSRSNGTEQEALREGRALIEEPEQPNAMAGCDHHFTKFGTCAKCGYSQPKSAQPEPARPVCATCMQTVWNDAKINGKPVCSDCRMMRIYDGAKFERMGDLDTRISAARIEPERQPWDWDARDVGYEP